MNFEQLGLLPQLLDAVKLRGYKSCTPIQAQAIPAVLKGQDVLGGAQTGTGKTAAFALPILQRLNEGHSNSKAPSALVLTPTRELADQVGESFREYGKKLKLKTHTVYGGVNINPQITGFNQGCDVVVATPGRLLDHLQQKTVNLSNISILVLDEADRMLDMGFIRDINKIISYLPKERQNLLFSATYSKEIRRLANDILNDPVSVEVTKRNSAAEKVEQQLYRVEKTQKRHLLAHLIKEQAWYQVLVFVRTKHGANRLCKQLDRQGIPSAAIHGDKSQNARTRALGAFKKGDLQALIATDVAARGIHLEDLSHVVNFDLPQVPEDYVHRIGRTGRAGKSGSAVSFVSSEEASQLKRIESLLKNPITPVEAPDFVPVVNQPQSQGSPNRGKSPGSSPRNRSRNSGKGAGERSNVRGERDKNRKEQPQRDKSSSLERSRKSPSSNRSKEQKSAQNRNNSSQRNRNMDKNSGSDRGDTNRDSSSNRRGRSSQGEHRSSRGRSSNGGSNSRGRGFQGARNAVLEATSWDA